jgi:transposase, IS5 family
MATDDFFRARLDQMIDLRHPLAVLATRMPWGEIEAALGPLFAHKNRAGHAVEDADLFGVGTQIVGAGVSQRGRPRLPIRLMVALLYLKSAFDLSDEALVETWARDVYFQFFSGMTYFEPKLPCDPSQLGRFRSVLGEAGVEHLLKTTIETAVRLKAIRASQLERVIVDTTVQEKAVAYPSDSRLLEVARAKIASLAVRAGVALKQSYACEGATLRRRAGGYAHAKQFKRLRRVLRRQRVILGRLLRDVQRKLEQAPSHIQASLQPWIQRAWRIQRQQPKEQGKLYALHAPEVECIGKGKTRQPYEFGVKTSLAVTHHAGLIVGARTFPGNPYDGHTLAQQLEQTTNLLQDLNVAPTTAIVDLGYRGVDDTTPVVIIHRGRYKTMTTQQRSWLKRRQAIEPVIAHVKHDHGMRRCWLKGAQGDALHAVLCAAGFNIRWLLRAIMRKAIRGLKDALLRLLEMARQDWVSRLQAISACNPVPWGFCASSK